jgi:hypothetical protein
MTRFELQVAGQPRVARSPSLKQAVIEYHRLSALYGESRIRLWDRLYKVYIQVCWLKT